MLRVAWLGTYVQTQHDDREDVVGQGMIDLVHDQALAVSEARVALDVGLTRRFGLSVVAPVRVVDSSIRYLAASDGSEVELVTSGIHHRDETLVGLADPMVLGAFTNLLGPVRLVLRAGLTLPIGRTEDNPFTAEAMTTAHQHVQMGTGTLNPVVAADVAYTRGPWRLGGFAFSQQVVYENGKGYQAGDRYAAGVALRRQLGKTWSLRGGVEVQGETAERWDGVIHTDDGNRGRFDAMAVAGGSWMASPQLAVDFSLKVPFVTHAVGGQLDMPAILEVGASWTFGGAAKPKDDHEDHDHAHGEEHAHGDEHGDEHADEHGDEHADEHAADPQASPDATKPDATKPDTTADPTKPDTAKADATKPDTAKPDTTADAAKPDPTKPAPRVDVADHGKPGEAKDLVPVRGKLTIFDFWATWCVPCKTLDPALVALAKQHPDLVAIRKIDVVDWDSQAAERYLTPGGFDLPHVKIFDPSGKQVFERSSAAGKLQALIDDVRALVAAEAAKRPARRAPAKAAAKAPVPARFEIRATARGFEPANTRVPRGVPVTLRFERTFAKTCATEVIFEVDGKKIEKPLPLNQRVELTVTFPRAGTITYRCAMDMIRGTITVD